MCTCYPHDTAHAGMPWEGLQYNMVPTIASMQCVRCTWAEVWPYGDMASKSLHLLIRCRADRLFFCDKKFILDSATVHIVCISLVILSVQIEMTTTTHLTL